MKKENEIRKEEEMIKELNEENLNKVSGGSLAQDEQFTLKLPFSEDEEPGGLKGFKNPM